MALSEYFATLPFKPQSGPDKITYEERPDVVGPTEKRVGRFVPTKIVRGPDVAVINDFAKNPGSLVDLPGLPGDDMTALKRALAKPMGEPVMVDFLAGPRLKNLSFDRPINSLADLVAAENMRREEERGLEFRTALLEQGLTAEDVRAAEVEQRIQRIKEARERKRQGLTEFARAQDAALRRGEIRPEDVERTRAGIRMTEAAAEAFGRARGFAPEEMRMGEGTLMRPTVLRGRSLPGRTPQTPQTPRSVVSGGTSDPAASVYSAAVGPAGGAGARSDDPFSNITDPADFFDLIAMGRIRSARGKISLPTFQAEKNRQLERIFGEGRVPRPVPVAAELEASKRAARALQEMLG
jgi:hypothetical protein